MVRPSKSNVNRTINSLNTWLLENQGCSVVLASFDLLPNSYKLWSFDATSRPKKNVSIVVCTYGRPESLNDTLKSLLLQKYKDFEVLLITEKGNLAQLRQKGLTASVGRIVSFIDDDVYCPTSWLQGVVENFGEGILGVSGPTTITKEYQGNRDCLKWEKLRKLQEWVFKVSPNPGKLSSCGAPSMASNFGGCSYEGEVDYLECCNMSVIREDAINAGGFDDSFPRTSEWSEVDLSLRLKRRGGLRFAQRCALFHRPSKAGVYQHRLSTSHRWENFKKFQKKWIKPSLRRHIYWAFIWTYFKLKEMRMI